MAVRKLYPSEQQDRLIIRFPDGMRDRIAALAKANGRSMNAEVINMIEASLGQTKRPLPIVSENTAEADMLWEMRDSIREMKSGIEQLMTAILVPDFTKESSSKP
jgi:hypothetical protein